MSPITTVNNTVDITSCANLVDLFADLGSTCIERNKKLFMNKSKKEANVEPSIYVEKNGNGGDNIIESISPYHHNM